MKISVTTPSYKQLPWLKLCVASVADQKGVEVEHLVQDALSDDGTADWLAGESRVKAVIEKDRGMYDAINRGFLRSQGDVVAWLNCDEQYLPGTLAKVADYFTAHPEVDVLFGDAVLLDAQGEILSYRKAFKPTLLHTQLVHLSTLSCATFVRRSVIERGLLLDDRFRVIADAVWVAAMLQSKLKMAVLNEPLSGFTFTGNNLGQTKLSKEESVNWRKKMGAPMWLKAPVVLLHRIRKALGGAYARPDLEIALYTADSPARRITKRCQKTPCWWPA